MIVSCVLESKDTMVILETLFRAQSSKRYSTLANNRLSIKARLSPKDKKCNITLLNWRWNQMFSHIEIYTFK